MSLTESQLQFAAEFVALVVSASVLALVVLRPDLRPASSGPGGRGPALAGIRRGLAALALLACGGAAFVHGSLLVTGADVTWTGIGRAVAAAVLAGAFPYAAALGESRSGLGAALMQAGFVAWLGAGLVEAVAGPPYPGDALLFAGSALVAFALLRVARRSIALRVAASGALTLLLVVILLALALSAVISSKLQSEELSRLSARASADSSALVDSSSVSSASEQLEAALSVAFSGSPDNPLSQFAAGVAPAGATERLRAILDSRAAGTGFTLAYGDASGRRVLASGLDQPLSAAGFAALPGLRPASCSTGRHGLFAVGARLYVAADTPVCDSRGVQLGVAIVADPVDRRFLARHVPDPGVDLAVVTKKQVFATSRRLAPSTIPGSVRLPAGPDGSSVTRAVGDRYVGVAVIRASTETGAEVSAYLLLRDQTNTVLSTRDQLFRTLFLIAFGGTILALGLAVFTGDRITAGVRRLTRAAAGIAAGDASLRAGVGGDDEVATLGSAFDAMVDSVTAQSVALQHAAEDETRLRNRLEAVVAGMNDALVAVDPAGRITEFNQAAAALTGVPTHQALGARLAGVVRLIDDDGSPIPALRLEAGAPTPARSGRVLGGDGPIPVTVSSGVLRGPSGEAAGTVLVLRDMRREQEVERMKTEFLSRIGHELRTPLTGILGYADILLRRDVAQEKAREWHDDILQSARRLLRIVEMLEFFASEGAGRVVLRQERVDLRAVVNGVASAWSDRLPPNLSIGRRLPPGEAVVTADGRWMTLAVDELIDNSVKFSPEGGRIVIRVAPGPDSVEVSVADQGMGMTARHREELFGDFVQGDNSDTRRFGGLGLGLAVVRRVVAGHGGTIAARSAPGRGTTVTLTLPVCRDGDPSPGRVSPTAEGDGS